MDLVLWLALGGVAAVGPLAVAARRRRPIGVVARIRPVEGRREVEPYRRGDEGLVEALSRMTRHELPAVALDRLAGALRDAGLTVTARRRRLDVVADGKRAVRLRVREPRAVTAGSLVVEVASVWTAAEVLCAVRPLLGPMEVTIEPARLLVDARATPAELRAAYEDEVRRVFAKLEAGLPERLARTLLDRAMRGR